MKKIQQRNDREKKKIQARHKKGAARKNNKNPMISNQKVKYGLSEKISATVFGGVGIICNMLNKLSLRKIIDKNVEVLKIHKPYHESDHVINIALNALTGGKTLSDIQRHRDNDTFLNAIGAESLPEATTAGDFCRRFEYDDIKDLMDSINEARMKVWKSQPKAFFETARIDGDGTLVNTDAECIQGIDINYKGGWGFHPLLISLANTQEPLFIHNRSGNKTSNDLAWHYFDKAAEMCFDAGFKDVIFRGDTDFSQTEHLDGWDKKGYGFVFGYANKDNLRRTAFSLEEEEYNRLVRQARSVLPENRRQKPFRFKQAIVEERKYTDIRLDSEDVAEFPYQPYACKETYRMIVLRKSLTIVTDGEEIPDTRYLFYITNRDDLSPAEVVAEANQRCNQENLIEQLKNGAHALRTPLNTLNANWAYMVMAALAWNLKAWSAMLLPTGHDSDEIRERHQLIRMDFRTWRNAIINIPCQIVKGARQLHYKILGWNPWQPAFWRLVKAME